MENETWMQAYTETTDFAAVCACFNLRKATRAITNLYEEYLRPVGLHVTQLTILIALDKAGPVTISGLSGFLALDRTTMTRDLQPLEREGWVKISQGEDRRKRLLSITPEGRNVKERAMPLWKEAQRRVISMLGESEYQALLKLMGNLAKLST